MILIQTILLKKRFQGKLNIFGDKAHFWLNDFVNKQNMGYWFDSSPHVLHKLRIGAVYGSAALLGRTSSVMIKTDTLL